MSDPKEVAARALALTKQIEAVFYHDHPGGTVQARSKVQVLLIEALETVSADLERVTAERDALAEELAECRKAFRDASDSYSRLRWPDTTGQ